MSDFQEPSQTPEDLSINGALPWRLHCLTSVQSLNKPVNNKVFFFLFVSLEVARLREYFVRSINVKLNIVLVMDLRNSLKQMFTTVPARQSYVCVCACVCSFKVFDGMRFARRLACE